MDDKKVNGNHSHFKFILNNLERVSDGEARVYYNITLDNGRILTYND